MLIRPLGAILLPALGLALTIGPSARATDIYQYRDRQGIIHFTDHPLKGSQYKLLKQTPTEPAPKQSRKSQSGTVEQKPAPPPAAVTLYKYLDRRGTIFFTDQPIEDRGYYLVWKSETDPLQEHQRELRRSEVANRVPTIATDRSRFNALIEATARRWQLNPALLHAVVRAESGYNPDAVSRAGASGLMQLMPGTAKRYGVTNLFDPGENLDAGAQYLSDLLALFDNDLNLALAGYNAGENNVIRYNRTIPPFPETRTYVQRVLQYYREFDRLVIREMPPAL